MVLYPVVTIKHGKVRGKLEYTKKNIKFFSFQNIPYAEPPIGKLRFKNPVEISSWTNIRDATQEGSICYSKDFYQDIMTGTEDCLVLNVYTPQLLEEIANLALKPVMVWIHGGGFIAGTSKRSKFGPEFLIDKDIVLVTINYRLGALGFLKINDPLLGVSGNAALKDQILALKWVQDNIKIFGGDPNNVTLFGESAGAACVGLHLVSPMAKGLFHKAIMQSGVATCPWVQGSHDAAYELLNALGLKGANDAEVLHALQTATKEEILQAQTMLGETWKPSVKRWFGPIVENPNSLEEIFLADEPIQLMKTGRYHKVPIIMGCTSGEGLLLEALAMFSKRNLQPINDEDYIPCTFDLEKGSKKSLDAGRRIREFYYEHQTPSDKNRQKWIDYVSDSYFVRPCLDVAEHILKTSKVDVFLYLFNIETKLNLYKSSMKVVGEGVQHGDDLFYLFPRAGITPKLEDGSVEAIAVEKITTLWASFAKYGNPNNFVVGIDWPVATIENMEYLYIDKEFTVQGHLKQNMNDFWKAIESM